MRSEAKRSAARHRAYHSFQSQAAPRTPLESPCAAGRIGVWKRGRRSGQQSRELSVELGNVGHATADDQHVRVEGVDHDGQPTGQPVEVAVPDQTRERSPVRTASNDSRAVRSAARQVDLGVPLIVLRERATGDPALEAAVFSAVAGRTRDLGDVGQRQRVVAPLPRAVVGAVVGAAVDRDARPGTRAEDHSEHDAMAGPAPSVASETAKQSASFEVRTSRAEDAPQVVLDGAAVQPGRVAPLASRCPRVQRTGQSDPERAGAADCLLDLGHQLGDHSRQPS